MKKHLVGIDVSKSTLDYYDGKTGSYGRIDNTSSSIREWLRSSYEPSGTVFVFEPTGTYSDKLASELATKEYEARLANPRHSHAFMKATGLVHRNDRNSAEALVRMALSMDLPIYEMADETKHKTEVLFFFVLFFLVLVWCNIT